MGEQAALLKNRRTPRRAIRRRIGVLCRGVYHVNEAYEIGEGGMMIGSSVPLKKGDRVVISLNFPGWLIIVSRAVVLYIKEPTPEIPATQYGVRFEEIDFFLRRKIRNFVATYATVSKR